MTHAGSEGFAAATQTHSRITTVSRRKATAPTQRRSESRRGLRHELGEEQVAEQHPEREDQAQLEGVRRGVRIDTLDHGLDEGVRDRAANGP